MNPVKSKHDLLFLKINQYTNLVGILLILISLLMGKYTIAAVLFVLGYPMFGFLAISQLFMMVKAHHAAYLCLCITCPFLLLPFTKAWYYLMRSQLLVILNNNKNQLKNKALKYAEKVNARNLLSDKNRFYYYVHMAALCSDSNKKEEAQDFLKLADETPHSDILENLYQEVKAEINKADSPKGQNP